MVILFSSDSGKELHVVEMGVYIKKEHISIIHLVNLSKEEFFLTFPGF
jgi:hypothetical protein